MNRVERACTGAPSDEIWSEGRGSGDATLLGSSGGEGGTE